MDVCSFQCKLYIGIKIVVQIGRSSRHLLLQELYYRKGDFCRIVHIIWLGVCKWFENKTYKLGSGGSMDWVCVSMVAWVKVLSIFMYFRNTIELCIEVPC